MLHCQMQYVFTWTATCIKILRQLSEWEIFHNYPMKDFLSMTCSAGLVSFVVMSEKSISLLVIRPRARTSCTIQGRTSEKQSTCLVTYETVLASEIRPVWCVALTTGVAQQFFSPIASGSATMWGTWDILDSVWNSAAIHHTAPSMSKSC